ncbi:MAG: hypothetical protein Q4A32_03750, partial [Lachnospiraceae bacterium]|nr:hypothetical protein [Lachnospiraceae bacterium]
SEGSFMYNRRYLYKILRFAQDDKASNLIVPARLDWHFCHPERSEGSFMYNRRYLYKILRFAQDDMAANSLLRSG